MWRAAAKALQPTLQRGLNGRAARRHTAVRPRRFQFPTLCGVRRIPFLGVVCPPTHKLRAPRRPASRFPHPSNIGLRVGGPPGAPMAGFRQVLRAPTRGRTEHPAGSTPPATAPGRGAAVDRAACTLSAGRQPAQPPAPATGRCSVALASRRRQGIPPLSGRPLCQGYLSSTLLSSSGHWCSGSMRSLPPEAAAALSKGSMSRRRHSLVVAVLLLLGLLEPI